MWTDEKVATLKKHWGVLKAREIGALIGMTRNAVLGKAHRMRMGKLCGTIHLPVYAPKKVEAPLATQSGQGVSFQECVAVNGCRYPYDNGTWCGQATTACDMCQEHHARCYTKPMRTGAPVERETYDILEELP